MTDGKKEGRDTLPHHRFELFVHIGANDWQRAARELREVADHVAEHGPKCSSCSGGAAVHSVTIVEDPEMTDAKYIADLERWVEARR